MSITESRKPTLTLRRLAAVALAFTLLPAAAASGQKPRVAKREKEAAVPPRGKLLPRVTVDVDALPLNEGLRVALRPCEGERPGNVLGVSEEWPARQRVAAFVEKLAAPEPRVRACAIRHLGYLGPEAKDAVPHLIRSLRDEENTDVSRHVTDALLAIGPERKSTVPELIQMAATGDAYVRLYAAFALGYYKPHVTREAEVLRALTQATRDEDGTVRWMALRGLARLGPLAADSVPVLTKILRDGSRPVPERILAALAIGGVGPAAADAAPAMLEVLYDDIDYILYSSTAIALAKIGPAILPLLSKDLRSDKTLLVLDVLKYLGPAGAPLVIEAMRTPNKEVRKKAYDALHGYGAAAGPAVPLLAKALKEADKEARLKAVVTLTGLGPVARDAVPALRAALRDAEPLVACWAAKGLGAIGEPAKPAVPDLLRQVRRPARRYPENFLQSCAAEALMEMSRETRALVPADLVKKVEEINKKIGSSQFDPYSDATRPKKKKPQRTRPVY